MHQNTKQKHLPVLLEAVLQYLKPRAGESYLDLTAGYGGHAKAILERTLNTHQAVLVDRDPQAVKALADIFGPDAKIIQTDFLSASRQLLADGQRFDLILADLGVSSAQLGEPKRGFSFADGPLDMRMDSQQSLSAREIVNSYSQKQLTDILRRYGEEPKASQLARAIITARPLESTKQLAEIARRVWPKPGRTHPATRLFQALRIAVNDELNLLGQALQLWIELLEPGGRLAIISFHSLEDRLVKQALSEAAGAGYEASLRLLTKSPVTATQSELALNPRARSAKLRAAVKIKIGREMHADTGKKQLPSVQS